MISEGDLASLCRSLTTPVRRILLHQLPVSGAHVALSEVVVWWSPLGDLLGSRAALILGGLVPGSVTLLR